MSAVRVDAGLLIPGAGEPVTDGAVVMDGGVITYAGPATGAPEAGETVRVPVVMPGMWECHGHFLGMKALDLSLAVLEREAVAAARAALDTRAALDAGFTSVREAGGYGVYLARLVEEGTLPGPAIYAPGAILSTTGGHGDIHGLPLPWMDAACRNGAVLRICDGVPECLRAVREQLRRNARVIKICASGGVMSEVDHPIHQQFSAEELRVIVEEAGRAERAVMAHCHGKPGIMAALEAGCRTIEHGTYLDEEAATAMRETGAILVPTRYIVERLLGLEGRMPAYAFAKVVAIAERHKEAIAIAHAAGVTIACGTDICTTGADTGVPWGANGQELALLVAAGLSPIDAIATATANGPLTLGPQAPRSGVLAEGHDADVIAVAADPLTDIAVLGDPRNVTHVWRAGVAVKAPAA